MPDSSLLQLSDPVLLTIVGVLGVAAVTVYLRKVLPGIATMSHPSIVVDVWGPIALVIPMVAMGARVEDTVASVGWVPLGGPTAVLLVGLGLAMLMLGKRLPAVGFTEGARWRLTLLVGGAGLLMLLLGAAHVMTVGIGQCAFAAAALILWMNTPSLSDAGDASQSGQDMPGLWVMLCLIMAIGQGVAALSIDGWLVLIANGLIIAQVGTVVAMTSIVAGSSLAIRLAGWVGGLGTLLGLGVISLRRLIPMAFAMDVTPGAIQVAFGFGVFAWEGAILIALAPAVAWAGRPGTRRPPATLGWALLLGGVALAGWRLLPAFGSA